MSWLKSIWRVLTIRCEETTRLMSELCDRKLTFGERVAIWAHELSCRPCRRFHQQLITLRSAIQQRLATQEGGLSPAARQRIIEALKQAGRDEAS